MKRVPEEYPVIREVMLQLAGLKKRVLGLREIGAMYHYHCWTVTVAVAGLLPFAEQLPMDRLTDGPVLR
ncbi:hypothetical protein BV902_02970 [Sphingobacterium sp. B29]|nr:hypothetical protein BV902_02970 [Sphingobacterium sp. B29]